MVKIKRCYVCKKRKLVKEFYMSYYRGHQEPESCCKKCHNKKTLGTEYARKKARRYTLRYPEKAKAHSILHRLVSKGLIKRPKNCIECGKKSLTEAHHPDYSKPDEVIHLCKRCHVNRHDLVLR